MPQVTQQPTRLDLIGTMGNQFVLTVNFKQPDGTSPLTGVSAAVVDVTRPGGSQSTLLPTITNPTTGVFVLSWSADQTTALPPLANEWSLTVTFSGQGTFSVLGGFIIMYPTTQPGYSDNPTFALAVTIGDLPLNLAVALGGVGGPGGAGVTSVNGDTGPAVTIALSDLGGASAAALASEATTRASADTTNATAIATEATTRGTADTTLQSNITSEASTRAAADTALATSVTNAIATAEGASDAAGVAAGLVATEATTRAAADTTNAAAISTETTNRTTADALLAPKASPALTGSPTAPTATALDNSTKLATTAYTDSAVAVETSRATTAEGTKATSAALTTETSRATAAEALLAPLASPALTGTPTVPTKTALTNSTAAASTAYADAAVGVETSRATTAEALKAPLASPALTGTPTAPTKTALTNSTAIATTAYTDAAAAAAQAAAEAASDPLGAATAALVPDLTALGSMGATPSVTLTATNTFVTGLLNANANVTVTGLTGRCTVLFLLTQDATGGRTFSIDGTAVVIPLAPNAVAIVPCYSDDGTNLYVLPEPQTAPFTGDVITSGTAATLVSTSHVGGVVRGAAYQDAPRRGGSIGVATARDASSSFPYGQIEVTLGDSIALAYGASSPGVTDRWALLAAMENRALGLPDAGIGLVNPGAGAGYGFSAIGANLTVPVAGGLGAGSSTAVSLTSTVNSTGAANSLTDNRPFQRVVIFYKPQTNSDGIGVSLLGLGGALAHTIDGTGIATGGNSTVAFWDSGALFTAGQPAVSLTRVTKVTGSGGVAPLILGVRYYAPGVTGTSGLLIENIAAGGLTTASWVSGSQIWASYLSAISAQVRRVHIALGGNDLILASASTVAAFNNSTTLNDASKTFATGDIGRPVTGNANIPAGTTIAAILSTTSVTLSAATTGGNLTGQSVTYGQMPIATIQANLTTIVNTVRTACPLAEIVLYAEYQPWSTALDPVGNNSPQYWTSTFVPAIEASAVANGCTFVNYHARFGSVSHIRTVADAVTNATATVTSATIAALATDLGSIVTGTNIPAHTYVGIINSGTSIGLSSSATSNVPVNATGSGSGGTLAIGNDVYGLTNDNLHFGDSTNSSGKVDGQLAQANLIRERLKYAEPTAQAWQQATVITTAVASLISGFWSCPGTGTQLWEVECVGGGGGGAGSGSAATSGTNQVGAGGGAQGESKRQILSLVGGTSYAVTVGGGGAGGAGGAAGGNPGHTGTQGGTTTFAGPTNIVASGGGGGLLSAATSTTGVNGGMYGLATSASASFPGCGGGSSAFGGGFGGAAVGAGAGGGAGGGNASSTHGGVAGGTASFAVSPAVGGAIGGTASTLAGGTAANAASIDYGAGGGGGGGGAGSTGAGGNGGNGGNGVIYLRRVG